MSRGSRVGVFVARGAMIGSIAGAIGGLAYAIAINEQTMFGSSVMWSPLYALMGAVPCGVAGVVLGALAGAITPVSDQSETPSRSGVKK